METLKLTVSLVYMECLKRPLYIVNRIKRGKLIVNPKEKTYIHVEKEHSCLWCMNAAWPVICLGPEMLASHLSVTFINHK